MCLFTNGTQMEKVYKKTNKLFLHVVPLKIPKCSKRKMHDCTLIHDHHVQKLLGRKQKKKVRRRKRVGNGPFLSSSPCSGSRKGQRKDIISKQSI